MVRKLDVTLVRSVIGEKPKTRATVRSLGLRRLHQTVQHDDTPDVRGMVHRVQHLVRVEEKETEAGAADGGRGSRRRDA